MVPRSGVALGVVTGTLRPPRSSLVRGTHTQVMGRCPSGQREQTVNLPALPSKVRILPGPPFERVRRARSRSEHELQHGDVEPAIELAADLALHADQLEPARLVECA